ncbi:hypothetical protein GCM10022238_14860 [Gordonia hankookensis]
MGSDAGRVGDRGKRAGDEVVISNENEGVTDESSEPNTDGPVVEHPDEAKDLMALDITSGPRGATVTATSATVCPFPMTLRWDGGVVTTTGPDQSTVSFRVGSDESAGGHLVSVSCGRLPIGSQTFTVEEPTVIGPATAAVRPDRVVPDRRVAVTVDDFACRRDRVVDFSWDGGASLGSAVLDGSGHADAEVLIPGTATIGPHAIHVSCPDGPTAVEVAITVLAFPLPTPAPTTLDPNATSAATDLTPGIWTIAVIIVVATITGLTYLRIRHPRHSRPRTRPDVEAEIRWTTPPSATIREHARPNEATQVVRVETRWDTGTQTIRGVDDDRNRLD